MTMIIKLGVLIIFTNCATNNAANFRRDINEKVEDDDEIEINEGVNDDPIVITSTSSTLRRQFKRCHGKCVQKFCLPIGDLTVYENCSNKCKGICSQ